MLALVTEPGRAHTTRVEEVALTEPREGEVLLRTLEIGVCGTDREISEGVFGIAPEGEGSLVLGHEALAVVERNGHGCERGITRLHGYARELVSEDPGQLIAIPKSLGRLGVLAEPTSICERALRHARTIGGRQPWQLERALVLGAGAIGVLTTYLLRLADVEVWTASLEETSEL